MPEIITIGESMVLLIANESGPMELVTGFTRRLAGAESNVAIGLARLGYEVGWISAVGDDAFGRYIVKTIRGEGVDTSQVVVDPDNKTGLMLKEQTEVGDPAIYYYRDHSAASRIQPAILHEQYFTSAKVLHVTGIFPLLSDSCRETLITAIELAKQMGLLISFDPNIRRQLWRGDDSRQILIDIARRSDLILPGIAEAEQLAGTSDWKKAAAYFHQLGNKIVIIKKGAEGAYYSYRDQAGEVFQGFEQGFFVPRVIDTVGAGDGFAAGVISGLLEDLPVHEAVRRGNAIGSLAVMVKGDSDGYPTREQLYKFMKLNKKSS